MGWEAHTPHILVFLIHLLHTEHLNPANQKYQQGLKVLQKVPNIQTLRVGIWWTEVRSCSVSIRSSLEVQLSPGSQKKPTALYMLWNPAVSTHTHTHIQCSVLSDVQYNACGSDVTWQYFESTFESFIRESLHQCWTEACLIIHVWVQCYDVNLHLISKQHNILQTDR